ncbi:type II toxin-antitoxin system RelE/ParE family toxin [Prochlorothrix hollandica]|uniref:Plasmid stabilization system protein, RelE/ParE family n=1 Tax=Prochlorothrix hollandica PCC 9006 = CALU 1027 TaxID=317619 RepID=A0A0M2PPZ7_PROHO|nr:type II toxin-antitoxin system RelE/ParE family toxin [Prochlorothrix hollandica]KKI98650.1 plasmid stabilization system protein, RelE/ParE family [Prochlorothrix hollandica PCC 9006 = CALU 1027]
MKQVVFHPLAEKELIDAAIYYEGQEPDLGEKYLAEVGQAVSFIAQYPEAGFIVRGSLRRLTLPKFPYYLLYRVLGNAQIRVLAVAHHKRRPKYWVDRE